MSDEQVTTESGATTRRALLVGAGAVGASVVLAACGSDKTSSGGGHTGAPSSAGGPSTATGQTGGSPVLGKTSDVPVGGGAVFPDQGVVVTQPAAGQFKGFTNICTHQGCPVANVDGGTINCTCHGSRFSITDGSVKNGPATQPLPTKQVKIEGDTITLA